MTDADQFDAFEGVIAELETVLARFRLAYRLSPSEANGAACDGLSDLIGELQQRQAQYEDAAVERRARDDARDRAWFQRGLI